MKYYIDAAGNYLGGFDGAEPPKWSIEVPEPPADAGQIWDFEAETWGELSNEAIWAYIRAERNLRIQAILWRIERYNSQLADVDYPVTDDNAATYQNILSYLQELRDITETYETPEDVIWPSEP